MKSTEPSGFQPAQRLVDLANLLIENPAADRNALVAVLSAHGETTRDLAELTEPATERLRAAIRRLTELLRQSDPDRIAAQINSILEECGSRPRLSNHGGHFWHLHVDRADEAPWDEWLAATSALALAQLLSERGRIAWGECGAPQCRRVFLHDGPGSPRRHCSPTCASRTRVARHRAKGRPTAP